MNSLCDEVMEAMEDLENNICALRALSGLFCGQSDCNAINLNEVSHLLDPIVAAEKLVLDKLRELCKKPVLNEGGAQ